MLFNFRVFVDILVVFLLLISSFISFCPENISPFITSNEDDASNELVAPGKKGWKTE